MDWGSHLHGGGVAGICLECVNNHVINSFNPLKAKSVEHFFLLTCSLHTLSPPIIFKQPAINDTVMRSQMDAVLDTSRKVGGVPTTLASLGFDWISMDDGYVDTS